MKLTTSSESGLIYVAEISEDLADQASLLLSLVERGAPKVPDGGKMRVDWGIARLTRKGNEVIVEEPDYRNDPLRFVPGLNFTCAVLRAQQIVHDRLGVGAEPVAYDQFVSVYPGGLTAPVTAVIRQDARGEMDTGWRVFDAARIDWNAELHARRVYELARERPALLGVLSLPRGWAVRLEGSVIVDAAPPEGSPQATGLAIPL